MTRAPRSARCRVHSGAAMACSRARTMMPDSGDVAGGAVVMRLMISLPGERIEDRDSGWLEVLDVAGDYGQAVNPGRGGDEGVDDREGLRVLLAAPGGGDRERNRQ